MNPASSWVVHADIDALRERNILQSLSWMWASNVKRAERDIGLTINEDVHAVTVYALPGQADRIVIVLTTTDRADGVHTWLKLAQPLTLRRGKTSRGLEYSRWKNSRSTLHVCVHPGRAAGQRIVVISEHKYAMEAGSEFIIDGLTKQRGSLPQLLPLPGAAVYAAVGDLRHDPQFKPSARMFKTISRAIVNITFGQRSLVSQVTLSTDTQETTDRLAAFMTSSIAYVRAGQTTIPHRLVHGICDGFVVSSSGTEVVLTASHEMQTVRALLNTYADRATSTRDRR